jgi:hypothetical protein
VVEVIVEGDAVTEVRHIEKCFTSALNRWDQSRNSR